MLDNIPNLSDFLKSEEYEKKCSFAPRKLTPLTKLLARQARPGTTHDGSGPKLKLIHPYQQQISVNQDKRYTNRILKASLFQFYFVLFKILLIKNIPSRHFENVHLPHQKNTRRKMVSVMLNVTCFNPILV